MNDFLERLSAERAKTSTEGAWQQWSANHISDGRAVWDASGNQAVADSIAEFLKMVTSDRMRSALILTAPRHQHDCAQYVPGVVRTLDRILAPGDGRPEARAVWQQEASQIRFVPVERTYLDDGYPNTEEFLVCEDGRVAGGASMNGLNFDTDVKHLYEAMAQFIIEQGL